MNEALSSYKDMRQYDFENENDNQYYTSSHNHIVDAQEVPQRY